MVYGIGCTALSRFKFKSSLLMANPLILLIVVILWNVQRVTVHYCSYLIFNNNHPFFTSQYLFVWASPCETPHRPHRGEGWFAKRLPECFLMICSNCTSATSALRRLAGRSPKPGPAKSWPSKGQRSENVGKRLGKCGGKNLCESLSKFQSPFLGGSMVVFRCETESQWLIQYLTDRKCVDMGLTSTQIYSTRMQSEIRRPRWEGLRSHPRQGPRWWQQPLNLWSPWQHLSLYNQFLGFASSVSLLTLLEWNSFPKLHQIMISGSFMQSWCVVHACTCVHIVSTCQDSPQSSIIAVPPGSEPPQLSTRLPWEINALLG